MTKKPKPQGITIVKVAEFPCMHMENIQRVAMALAQSGRWVRIKNSMYGVNLVVEVYEQKP